VPTARRTRVVAASPEALWQTVGDAHHLPRWWPRVQRVERVDGERFTEVLLTKKGRAVRADFRVGRSERPRVRAWEQDVVGSPFARILESARTEVRLEPEGEGTRVTLELEQRLLGVSRLGAFMVRRATARVLDGALDALEELHGA
jgi:uncharacterized protein YndB with AHSA1/START domain